MSDVRHLTTARIHLDRLTRNLERLRAAAGGRPLWPAVKANAYGHGAALVARHLVDAGVDTLCVAHAPEAIELVEAGVDATFLLLSASLPEHSEAIVAHGLEPAVTSFEVVESLSREAERVGRTCAVHLKVDTGMGRTGIRPDAVPGFLERCRALGVVRVKGLMSHPPRADEADRSYSRRQIEVFRGVVEAARGHGVEWVHMANSAAILDFPEAAFDACRPGIALYGLVPSDDISSATAAELEPVLEWASRITFLKEVPAGTGLSYGHTFTTDRPTLVATIPLGYGDGLHRGLSDRMDALVHGTRCPQLGRITMDQCLVDVTSLRGRVALGDEVVVIGRQGDAEIPAGELAALLGTIHYEVVTSISARVPRIAASSA